jgi:hypothetical protein
MCVHACVCVKHAVESYEHIVILYLHKPLLLCLWNIKEICIYKHMLKFPWIWNLIRSTIICGISKKYKLYSTNIINILHGGFKCVIKFFISSIGLFYNTLNLRMIKCNLYIFPYSLILNQIIYYFILLLMLTDITAIFITSQNLLVFCSQNQLWTQTAKSNTISTNKSVWTQFFHSSRGSS